MCRCTTGSYICLYMWTELNGYTVLEGKVTSKNTKLQRGYSLKPNKWVAQDPFKQHKKAWPGDLASPLSHFSQLAQQYSHGPSRRRFLHQWCQQNHAASVFSLYGGKKHPQAKNTQQGREHTQLAQQELRGHNSLMHSLFSSTALEGASRPCAF